jgi:hypothetical protein
MAKSYSEMYLNKINKFYDALKIIQLFPDDKNSYINLYQEYLLSYPYISKVKETNSLFIGNLKKFKILDTHYNSKNFRHRFTFCYENEHIHIDSQTGFHAFICEYVNKEKNIYIYHNFLELSSKPTSQLEINQEFPFQKN